LDGPSNSLSRGTSSSHSLGPFTPRSIAPKPSSYAIDPVGSKLSYPRFTLQTQRTHTVVAESYTGLIDHRSKLGGMYIHRNKDLKDN
jgi:hypothetical protein